MSEEISHLDRVAWDAEMANYHRWFPKSYPADKDARRKKRIQACREFVFNACKSRDEFEQEGPKLKLLPRLDYLDRILVNLNTHNLLVVPKSRRVMGTIVVLDYLLWRALADKFTRIALVPETEPKGLRQIEERLKEATWRNMPDFVRAMYKVRDPLRGVFHVLERRNPVTMKWEQWESKIEAFPKGIDQLRDEGYSIVFWDEYGAQREAKKGWKAIAPTLLSRKRGGHGQLIAVSSVRKGHHFQELYQRDRFLEARKLIPGIGAT